MEDRFPNISTRHLRTEYSEYLDHAPIGIIALSKEGEIEYVNKSLLDIAELYKIELPSALIGSNITSLETPLFTSLRNEIPLLLNGIPFEAEIENPSLKSKGLIKLIVKGSSVFSDENITGGILIFEDVKILSETISELQLRADFVEKAVELVTDFYLAVDINYKIKFHSKNIYGEFFKDKIFTAGASLADVFQTEDSAQLKSNIENCIQTKKLVVSRLQLEEVNFECRFIPHLDNQNNISFIFIFFKNVSSIFLENLSNKNEFDQLAYYKLLTSKFGEAVFAFDKKGIIVYWDEAAEKVLGKKKIDALATKISDLKKIFDKNKFETILQKLDERDFYKTILNSTDSFKQMKVLECVFSYYQEEKEIIVAKCEDITEKIHFEEGIKLSLKAFEQLTKKSTQMLCNVDQRGQIIFANETFLNCIGYSEEEILSLKLYDIIHQDYFERNLFTLDAFQTKDSSEIELPFITKWNSIINLKSIFKPILDDNKNLQFISCYYSEVGELKSKEKELDLYRSLIESSLDGIALVSDSRIIIANKSFATIFGYDEGEELTNKEILDFASNEDILKVAEYFRLLERKKDAPSRFDFLGKKRDNTYLHTEISVGSFEIEKKSYFILVARDITERIRAQKAIRDSEEKYRNITENIDDFLFTFERIGYSLRPIFCTNSILKVTGYSQADFLTDSKLFLKLIHPDDFKAFKPRLMNLLKSRIQLSGEFEFRVINKQGNIVWVRTKLNLMRFGTGRIHKVFGLVSDITFRKRAEEELKKSTENLVKLNETKDRFISIVSHDLRTPFSSILGFTDLLANDEELTDEERKQYVRYIQESSRSMLSLVNSLLDWTRLQTGRIKFEPQKINVTKILQDSINALSGNAIQKNIEVTSKIEQDLYLFVDKSLIVQVFNNLISNAIKFTNIGGKVTISAAPDSNLRFYQFTVSDNGLGMSSEDLQKLFKIDAKFTSEGTAGERGSGLGLSLVKEIIDKHNGNIWVKSGLGKGSDFSFTLPIASANILIVDDNKTDRLLYSKILKNITPDYNIDVASNGKEALEKIATSPPALVITDHAMPVMNGYEFISELKKSDIKGKPPVIVLSSDIDRSAINDYSELGIEFVFQKPVNISSFKLAVEKSLQKGMASG